MKIKKNAVIGAKVKDHSLTRDDIDLAKLGTVPSAQTANTASGLAPAEATHFVGTAGEPPFTGEATNAGPEAGYVTPKVGFCKDHEGIVHLTGMAKTDPVHTTIFILPVGYRPAPGTVSSFLGACGHVAGACDTDSPAGNESRFAPVLVAGTNASIEAVNVEGRVLALPGVIVSLDEISFRAES